MGYSLCRRCLPRIAARRHNPFASPQADLGNYESKGAAVTSDGAMRDHRKQTVGNPKREVRRLRANGQVSLLRFPLLARLCAAITPAQRQRAA